MNIAAMAESLMAARDAALPLPLVTGTHAGFTMSDAYLLADHIRRLRIARGERPRGYKIGFTNRSIWPKYGVSAPIWAPVWDSTLHLIEGTEATVSLAGLVEPRLEPEIVFGFAKPPRAGMTEGQLADCIEWVAHGFEIVHTHFAGWRFQAPDTVADFGLHGRLLVGPRVAPGLFVSLADELAAIQLQLLRDDQMVDEGQGRAVLGGPLTALGVWVDAMLAQPHGWPIMAGDAVTTGTLTDAWPMVPGQAWQTRLSDPRLPGLRLLAAP